MNLEKFKILFKSFLMKHTLFPENEIDNLVLFNACYFATPNAMRSAANDIVLEAALKMQDNLATEEERKNKN